MLYNGQMDGMGCMDGWDGMDGWMGWDGWMVIIGHRSSKSTFGANNVPHSRVWKSKLEEFRYFVNI